MADDRSAVNDSEAGEETMAGEPCPSQNDDYETGWSRGYADARDGNEYRDLAGFPAALVRGYVDGWNVRCDEETEAPLDRPVDDHMAADFRHIEDAVRCEHNLFEHGVITAYEACATLIDQLTARRTVQWTGGAA